MVEANDAWLPGVCHGIPPVLIRRSGGKGQANLQPQRQSRPFKDGFAQKPMEAKAISPPAP
jgi:hypothetical protein